MIPVLGVATVLFYMMLVRPGINRRRWGPAMDLSSEAMLMGVMSILFLSWFVEPLAVPMIVIAIAVHEYGHVLAYRITGHQDPKFQLVPLGGGRLFPATPSKSSRSVLCVDHGAGLQHRFGDSGDRRRKDVGGASESPLGAACSRLTSIC